MSLTQDILRSYRAPRAVLRRRIGPDPREDRALAVLMGACLLLFVAQWPGHARAAHMAPEVPLDARLTGALMGTIFLLPLLAYAVAAASHLLLRLFGGRGTFHGARVALFWAMLAVAPLMLLNGLVRGMIGPGPAETATGAVAALAFLAIWGAGLRVAEFERGGHDRLPA